jgi:hypothetical protein
MFLIKHHSIKTYRGVEIYLHSFITSALDGEQQSTSRLGRFTSEERKLGTYLIGGCVGSKPCLKALERREKYLVRVGNLTTIPR